MDPCQNQNAETAAEVAADVASVEQQLADVQNAINAVETRGQMFKIKDREVKRADLATLHKREDQLKRSLDRTKRRGVRVQRIIPL